SVESHRGRARTADADGRGACRGGGPRALGDHQDRHEEAEARQRSQGPTASHGARGYHLLPPRGVPPPPPTAADRRRLAVPRAPPFRSDTVESPSDLRL